MKWEEVRLGDVCKSIADGDHQSPQKQVQGIPFITISNIDANNRIDFTNSLYVSEDYYESIADKRKAAKDDVLYSVVGSFGVPVLLRENIKFAFQRHIAILRPDKEKIFPVFLYYSMLTRDFYLQADSVAIGSAQRTITLTTLKNMKLSLPPLPVQKRIASILSAYDDLIENNQKQINLLEEAAQRLYKEWFVDLRFPGHESVKVVDGVPEGWKKEKLIELAELKAGGDKPKIFSKIKSNICKVPIFSNGLENEGLFGYTDKADIGQESITISARGNVGYTCLRREPYLAIVRLICVIPRKMHISTYLYFYLKHTNYNSNGSAQQQLTIPMIKNTVVCVPDENILSDFDDKARCYFDLVDALKNKISSLREARDRLLPKLMSGEIEV